MLYFAINAVPVDKVGRACLAFLRRLAILILALAGSQPAMALPVTAVNLTFQGLNLTGYGGPTTDILFSLRIPQDAPDRAPETPFTSQYAADVEIVANGQTFATFGFLQMGLSQRTGKSYLTFTIAYPNEVFPGYALNAQISGLELDLFDDSGRMVTSEVAGNLAPDFASLITGFAYYARLGGWGPGQGNFRDSTSASLSTARFLSDVTFIVSEPSPLLLVAIGIALMSLRRRPDRYFGVRSAAPSIQCR